MSFYMEGKILMYVHRSLDNFNKHGLRQVSSANILFLIGTSPNIQDVHIWEPLAKSKAFLYFIGDERALETWKEKSRTGSIEFLGDKFNVAYPSIVANISTDAAIN